MSIENSLQKEVYTILDKEGLQYLKHNLAAKPRVVYINKNLGWLWHGPNETKVADITLELIK